MSLFIYIVALAVLVALAPAAVWRPADPAFLVVIGLIGVWRYGWQAVHLVRAVIYRRVVFPRRRGALPPPDTAAKARHVFLCAACHRVPAETVALSIRAAVQEAAHYGAPATLVVTTAEIADHRLIKGLFARLRPPSHVRLVLLRRPPLGKRDALAAALRAVARMAPEPGAAVVLFDPDAVMPHGLLERCLPFFRARPEVWGLTTDEDGVVRDGGGFYSAWRRLRFARRHLVMCSLGLSDRLLCLTGRLSILRAEVAVQPSFIARVERDHLDHWRLGRVPLLTGEDKSSWLWVLERGGALLYVPDVRVATVETPPEEGALVGSTRLMRRWGGNMLRANGPALRLGPGRLGPFLWWCLIDQRIAPWTTLVAPVAVLLALVEGRPAFLYAYLLWLGITRLVQTFVLLGPRGRVDGWAPLALAYDQLWGALVRVVTLFRLDRQAWTRQNVRFAGMGRARALISYYACVLALGYLVLTVAVLGGHVTPPDPSELLSSLPF